MQSPFVQLAEIHRGPAVESIHHGIAVVMDSNGRQVLAMGDPAFVTFPRSSLKPYQAVALVETGAADALGLGRPRLARLCLEHGPPGLADVERHVLELEYERRRRGREVQSSILF